MVWSQHWSQDLGEQMMSYNMNTVIVRECGQTLGLELVDKNRTVVYY